MNYISLYYYYYTNALNIFYCSSSNILLSWKCHTYLLCTCTMYKLPRYHTCVYKSIFLRMVICERSRALGLKKKIGDFLSWFCLFGVSKVTDFGDFSKHVHHPYTDIQKNIKITLISTFVS